MDATGVLIVGAGQAGATAAAALRGFGYAGRIVMAGAERPLPYERPPLSKAMLSGDSDGTDYAVHPHGFHEEKSIGLLLGTPVTALDTAARTATLADGSRLAYDDCLLATGGNARTVAGLPPGAPGVHYLRSMADALRLRHDLRRHRSVLIVGGGFLGLEVASTAQALGVQATVLESADRVLARVVPPALSDWLQQRIAAAGVDLRLGARCEAFALGGADGPATATLAGGGTVSADMVVVAVGLEPETALARAAGIGLHPANHGIRVDARCATDTPHVYAAGDCCSQLHPFIGAELRLESWQSANEQARLAAAAIAGAATGPLAAPWFWSDQFGCNLQMLGMPVPGLTYHGRGALGEPGAAAPKFLLLGADAEGRVAHAIAVNAGGDLRQLKALIDSRTPCDLQVLCDATAPLKQQVRAALAKTASPAIS